MSYYKPLRPIDRIGLGVSIEIQIRFDKGLKTWFDFHFKPKKWNTAKYFWPTISLTVFAIECSAGFMWMKRAEFARCNELRAKWAEKERERALTSEPV